jgi:hypothetical protein
MTFYSKGITTNLMMLSQYIVTRWVTFVLISLLV